MAAPSTPLLGLKIIITFINLVVAMLIEIMTADLYRAFRAMSDKSDEETDGDVYFNGWTVIFSMLSLFGITVAVFIWRGHAGAVMANTVFLTIAQVMVLLWPSGYSSAKPIVYAPLPMIGIALTWWYKYVLKRVQREERAIVDRAAENRQAGGERGDVDTLPVEFLAEPALSPPRYESPSHRPFA